MRASTDWEIVSRYLAGELSASEREAFERGLAADAALAREVAFARRVAERAEVAGATGMAGDRDVIWAKLTERLAASAPARRRIARAAAWRLAACLVLALGVGLVWRASAPARHSVHTLPIHEHAAGKGERASFRLPDGTRVLLGPASVLRYSMTADGGPRTVALEGQGYFVVTHDAARPFMVRAGNAVAEDLGTVFTVRAYPEDRHARVAVREGVVAVHDTSEAGGRRARVRAGEAAYIEADGVPVVQPADTAAEFAWTQGRLEFFGTPLSDVAAQLSRWYDLDVRLADSAVARRRLTASFGAEPASEMLRLLESSGLRIERQGAVIVIRSK